MTLRASTRAAAAGALVWTIYGFVLFSYFYVGIVVLNITHPLVIAALWIALPHFLGYAVAGALAGLLVWSMAAGLLKLWPRARVPDARRQFIAAATASLIVASMAAFAYWSAPAPRNWSLFAAGGLLLAAVVADVWQVRGARWLAVMSDPWIVSFILVGIPWAWTRIAVPDLRTYLMVALGVVVAWAAVAAIARVTVDRYVGHAWHPLMRRSVAFAGIILAVGAISVGGNSLFVGVITRAPGGNGAAPQTSGLEARPPIAPAPSAASRPDVVLIVMDTVRADHLPMYGYTRDTAPFLTRLAEDATVYSRAVAASNMTLTSHASLLTGQYPRRHGAHYLPPRAPKGQPVAASTETMAELLAAGGYRTAAVVANQWYLDAMWGMAQGFQYYDDRALIGIGQAESAALLQSALARFLPWAIPSESWRQFRRGDDITRDAVRQLDGLATSGAPFFLFLNYMDAHHPWVPPPPYDTRYPGGNPRYTLLDFNRIRNEVVGRQRDIAPEERAAMIAAYDGGLAYVDRQIEAVAARLGELGRLDNTLFIVTSDHGEAFGRHALIGHGKTTAESQTSVPLLVKFPWQQSGRRVDVVASHVDVLPTVLSTAGLALPSAIDGQDLATIDAHPDRTVVAEAFRSPYFLRFGSSIRMAETAVYSGTHKLIIKETGEQSLFDLSSDPSETRDLFAAEPLVAAAFGTRLDRWLAAVPSASRSTPDQATQDRLKSLGYVR